jgi:hypothetical protein
MINALKQSTAATLYVGPVLAADGTPYTGMAIGDFQLVKNGTRGSFNGSATATHDTVGFYAITAQAADTDTLGRATVIANKATYVMPPTRYQVVTADVFNALVGNTINLKSDVVSILASALTEDSGGYLAAGFKKAYNVATPVWTAADVNQTGDAYSRIGAAGAGLTAVAVGAGGIAAASFAAGAINAAAIADAAIDNATFAADVGSTAYASNTLALAANKALANTVTPLLPTALVGGKMDSHVNDIAANAVTAAAIADGAIDNATFAADVGSTAYASNAVALAANKALANTVTPLLPTALVGGKMDSHVNDVAANAITAAAIATNAIDADALATDAVTEIVSLLLKLDVTTISGEAADSVLNFLRFLRYKKVSGDVLTVYKEDGTTPAWTANLVTDDTALPVVEVDPA